MNVPVPRANPFDATVGHATPIPEAALGADPDAALVRPALHGAAPPS